MSDETVRVPAADILALAGRWEFQASHPAAHPLQVRSVTECVAQLRALVDAVERPEEACEMCAVAHPANDCAEVDCWHNCDADRRAPAAPVGEPLCKCGRDHQWSSGTILSAQGTVCGRCPCTAFTPAPLSSPRRTRDPYGGKYNTDLTDYRAKVLAECDDPECDHNRDEGTCDHDCAVIVSYEDYQRSEGVCVGCGVRMKNDTETGWGPLLPFGDVPCGSRVGECCPPHKFTNEGAPDVCDTCGDSEHPPASDEGSEDEAEAQNAAEAVIDAIEETFLPHLPSKAISYCAQEDVNAGLDALRERFGLEEGR